MWKLIKYEFKKIFKSKVNVLLVLLVIGTCFYMAVYQTSHHYEDQFDPYTNEKGEVLSSVEVYRYMDSVQRKYAGETNEIYLNKMSNVLDNLIKEHHLNEFDKKWMIEHYGENYEELLKRLEENSITQDELDEQLKDIKAYQNEYYVGFLMDHWEYETKMINSGFKRLLMNAIDTKLTDTEYFIKNKNTVVNQENIENNENNNLILNKLSEMDNVNQKQMDYLNKKIQAMPTYNGSTVGLDILYRLLISGNTFQYILLLVLIMVLCSGIFSCEKNTESLLLTTKKGYKQVTIAKLITSSLVAILLVTIVWAGIFIYVRTIVPIDSFNQIFSIEIYTYKEIFTVGLIVIYFAALASGISATFLSCMTKNRFASIVPLILINFLSIMFRYQIHVQLLDMIPLEMSYLTGIDVWYKYVNNALVVKIYSIGNVMVRQEIIIVMAWFIIAMILSLLCYFKQKRHLVR